MRSIQRAQRFAELAASRRIWTVSAIRGRVDQLRAIHQIIDEKFQWGDRIVYLGGHMGAGSQRDSRTDVAATIEELLTFRRYTLSRFGFQAEDIVFLRGQSEEMWDKLLQIQFANDPARILEWMVEHGLDASLQAYGSNAREALAFARQGVVELTNYTTRLRKAMRATPGHFQLMTALRRACYTDDRQLLFVHGGIDARLPLKAQTDAFWWATGTLPALTDRFQGFRRIFSGATQDHAGIEVYPFATTIDGGCGYNGTLVASCITPDGEFIELYQA